MSSYNRDFGHIPNSNFGLHAGFGDNYHRARRRAQAVTGDGPSGALGLPTGASARPTERVLPRTSMAAPGARARSIRTGRPSTTSNWTDGQPSGRRFPVPAPPGLIPLPHGRPHPARRSAACRAPPQLHLDPGRAQRAAVSPEAAPPAEAQRSAAAAAGEPSTPTRIRRSQAFSARAVMPASRNDHQWGRLSCPCQRSRPQDRRARDSGPGAGRPWSRGRDARQPGAMPVSRADQGPG